MDEMPAERDRADRERDEQHERRDQRRVARALRCRVRPQHHLDEPEHRHPEDRGPGPSAPRLQHVSGQETQWQQADDAADQTGDEHRRQRVVDEDEQAVRAGVLRRAVDAGPRDPRKNARADDGHRRQDDQVRLLALAKRATQHDARDDAVQISRLEAGNARDEHAHRGDREAGRKGADLQRGRRIPGPVERMRDQRGDGDAGADRDRERDDGQHRPQVEAELRIE